MLAACEAAGDPDRLMRQAAHGLAVHIARAVTQRPALGEPTVPAPASLAVQAEPAAASGARALPRGGLQRGGLIRGARIVGLIGPGNNGGDGLYALAGLAGRGARCVAVMVADRWHERAAAAARDAGVEIVLDDQEALDQLATADVIVDAVLGIGAKGGMPIPGWDSVAQRWAVAGEALDALVVAADCPSGLNTATGAADELVPAADMTVTFGALKRGLVVGAAREKTGHIHLVEIGLQPPRDMRIMPRLVTLSDTDRELLAPRASDHKYSRGVLGVLAGSPAYPGAAVLCAKAAADIGAHDAGRGGTGMLVSAGRGAGGSAVVQALPEVVAIERGELTKTEWPAAARKVSAWVVGPGLGDDPEDIEPALAVMRDSRGPVVVDASALAVWEPAGLHVLTPHAGEFAALAKRLGVKTAAPNEDPLTAARDLASETGAVVLLKGSATVIAGPDGATFVAASAAPTLARAGSGDKLAGVVGAMLATHAARAASSGGELTPERIAQLTAAAAVLHGVKYSAV